MLPKFYAEMRVGTDVSYKFSANGMAIASFSAVADKVKKNAAGEWEKDKEIWVRVTCFKQLADNVAESVTKGSLVMVSGQVSVDKYETKDGEPRQSVEVVADEVGLSLRFKPAHVVDTKRTESSATPADDNPWATASADAGPPF